MKYNKVIGWIVIVLIFLTAIWIVACISQTVIVGEDIDSTKRSITIDVKKDTIK